MYLLQLLIAASCSIIHEYTVHVYMFSKDQLTGANDLEDPDSEPVRLLGTFLVH